MNNEELITRFFLLLVVILVAIRFIGSIGKKIGQVQAVSEMITGIILGPSLLGLIFPNLYEIIFPKQVISVVFCVSQIGLVLYMFLIGTEFNYKAIEKHVSSAISISLAGILTSFILGGILAAFIFQDTRFFSENIKMSDAILFTGAAMSVTAFPFLARIVHEKGMSNTTIGTLSLTAGAFNDAVVWCILAITMASFSGRGLLAFLTIGGGALYVYVMFVFGKPLLKKLEKKVGKSTELDGRSFGLILILVMICAYYTECIGMYSVFGAFVIGTVMPKGFITDEIHKKLEPITTNFLLPLYFIYSGLNTKLNLLFSQGTFLITIVVIIIACFGKGVACWAAARLNRESNMEALAIGTLMNSRGLMEMILLNIGLEKGIITPVFFTIMAVMAIFTTIMVSPMLEYTLKNDLNYFRKIKNFKFRGKIEQE